MLDASKNEELAGGRVIKAGIEFDALGRRRAYWMFPVHPGEAVGLLRRTGTSIPIPADQIIHVFHPTRAGQVRGVPGLASVLTTLKEILEVQDAYILRQKIQNLFASFETIPTPNGVSILDTRSTKNEASPKQDDQGVDLRTLEPGEHRLLPMGHEIRFSDPPQDAGHYKDFMKAGLRAVAMGAGVTYEQVSGDLEGVNFSSIRAGLIEFRRRVEQHQQNVLVFQLCRPVWRRWFETAALSGAIQIPASERRRTRMLLSAKWQPPGFEYVQPEEDVKAAVRRIRAGLSSRAREVARLGIDVEELDREIAADNARAEDLGLILTSNAKHVSDSGVGQSQDLSNLDTETGEFEEPPAPGQQDADEAAA